MTDHRKIQLIHRPFLNILPGFTILYTFLDWLLFIRLKLWNVDRDSLTYVLPALFAILPVRIWLYPRLKLLQSNANEKPKPDADEISVGFGLGAVLIIGICTSLAQAYLYTASADLVQLDNIHEISHKPQSDYYHIRNMYVDTAHAGIYYLQEFKNRKHDRTRILHCNIASPLLRDSADTARKNVIWIGKAWERRQEYQSSRQEVLHYVKQNWQEWKNLAEKRNFVYLTRLHEGYTYYSLFRATQEAGSADRQPVILIPCFEPFEDRNGDTLYWFFGVLAAGLCVWYGLVQLPVLHPELLREYEERHTVR